MVNLLGKGCSAKLLGDAAWQSCSAGLFGRAHRFTDDLAALEKCESHISVYICLHMSYIHVFVAIHCVVVDVVGIHATRHKYISHGTDHRHLAYTANLSPRVLLSVYRRRHIRVELCLQCYCTHGMFMKKVKRRDLGSHQFNATCVIVHMACS